MFSRRSPDPFKSTLPQGKSEHGDCGEKIGFWYAICGGLLIIPCVNYLAGPAGLVLLIIYLVKIHGLKKFVTG